MGCLVTACLPSSLSALRQEREVSRRLVADRFPQLADLVDDGPLLVVERSPSYWERREDGFQEPQLLFLLGTSHFSTVSALHVHRVVTNVLPQSVVVELCRSRARLMNEFSDGKAATRPSSNLLVMGGKSFGAAMGRSLGMGGQPAMILRFLLALASKKLSSVAGVASGEEFRAAYKAAAEVDAQIVLGDRPIEITYLAWALSRSKAVNGSSRVVGIVGQGHLRGIVHALKQEKETLRFRDLAGIGAIAAKHDAGKQMRQFFFRLIVETMLGFSLWLAFDCWCANGGFPIFPNLFKIFFM